MLSTDMHMRRDRDAGTQDGVGYVTAVVSLHNQSTCMEEQMEAYSRQSRTKPLGSHIRASPSHW